MLIFDRKKVAGSAAGRIDGSSSQMKTEASINDDDKILQSIAEDAINAAKSGSALEFMKAMKAFFYQCDALPHDEGAHE